MMKIGLLVIVFIVGMLFTFGSSEVLEQTNTTEFCTSCHSMQWVKEEWMESVHYKNASGVRAECADCHVPHSLGAKTSHENYGCKRCVGRDYRCYR